MRALAAFVARDLRIALSYRVLTLLQGVSFAIGVLSSFFLSELVGEDASARVGEYGGDYFAFLLVGLALWGFLTAALQAGATSLRQELNWGTLETVLMAGASPAVVVVGAALSGLLGATLNATAMPLAGIWLGGGPGEGLSPAGVLLALAAVALTALAALGAGFCISALTLVLKKGDNLYWLVAEAAAIVGGVYYPTSVLPRALRLLGELSPLTPGLRVLRRALLGDASWRGSATDCLALTLWAVVLLAVGLWNFRVAVDIARRDASLAHT